MQFSTPLLLAAALSIGGSMFSADVLDDTPDAQATPPAQIAINNPPVVPVIPNQVKTCHGATTVFTIDASGAFDPDGDPITFEWLACPGSTLSSTSSPIVQLTLDTSVTCDQTCGVRLRVTDSHRASTMIRMSVQVIGGNEGCSPGYWKNHAQSWGPSGFLPTDDFDTIFGVNAFNPDRTLMTALNTGGGGLNKLGRMATAALLNASHPGVSFPRSMTEVIDQVHDAIVSGQYEPLATQLDTDNNLVCPLH